MVELVDTLDLGSSAVTRGGSSPLFGTINKIKALQDITKTAKPFFIGLVGIVKHSHSF